MLGQISWIPWVPRVPIYAWYWNRCCGLTCDSGCVQGPGSKVFFGCCRLGGGFKALGLLRVLVQTRMTCTSGCVRGPVSSGSCGAGFQLCRVLGKLLKMVPNVYLQHHLYKHAITCICMSIYTTTYIFSYMWTHTYSHTYINTHTHTHTHTQILCHK